MKKHIYIFIFIFISFNYVWGNIPIKRDPFEPVKVNKVYWNSQKQPGQISSNYNLKLVGILWSDSGASALIKVNNETVIMRNDGSFYQILIYNISKERVLLKYKNKNYILEIGKEIIL